MSQSTVTAAAVLGFGVVDPTENSNNELDRSEDETLWRRKLSSLSMSYNTQVYEDYWSNDIEVEDVSTANNNNNNNTLSQPPYSLKATSSGIQIIGSLPVGTEISFYGKGYTDDDLATVNTPTYTLTPTSSGGITISGGNLPAGSELVILEDLVGEVDDDDAEQTIISPLFSLEQTPSGSLMVVGAGGIPNGTEISFWNQGYDDDVQDSEHEPLDVTHPFLFQQVASNTTTLITGGNLPMGAALAIKHHGGQYGNEPFIDDDDWGKKRRIRRKHKLRN